MTHLDVNEMHLKKKCFCLILRYVMSDIFETSTKKKLVNICGFSNRENADFIKNYYARILGLIKATFCSFYMSL